jgi:8-oxo-dGTP pyrophosphatase MutT (NUDIX family)
VRIRPHYSRWPRITPNLGRGSIEDKINAFFELDWVKRGDPEILFIKRAANKYDKWTGHIAFPGGGRDPEDEDDYSAAIRETWEEVGIDLRVQSSLALPAGNLAQTVITASWGEKPLMVYCPFVFLITTPNLPALRTQPREVASAHWVPIRSLLDPKFRTYWFQDVSSRTSRSDYGMTKAAHRILTGKMMFAAIRLHPSESKFTTETVEYAGKMPELESLTTTDITVPLLGARQKIYKFEDTGETLLLWGLTLSVVGDFLDMLPPHDAINQFVYPTFTALDIRFFLWIMSYNYRRQKVLEAQKALEKTNLPDADPGSNLVMWTSEDGVSEERYYGRIRADIQGRRGKVAFGLLPGYYPIIRHAVIAALVTRAGLAAGLTAILITFVYRRWAS